MTAQLLFPCLNLWRLQLFQPDADQLGWLQASAAIGPDRLQPSHANHCSIPSGFEVSEPQGVPVSG